MNLGPRSVPLTLCERLTPFIEPDYQTHANFRWFESLHPMMYCVYISNLILINANYILSICQVSLYVQYLRVENLISSTKNVTPPTRAISPPPREFWENRMWKYYIAGTKLLALRLLVLKLFRCARSATVFSLMNLIWDCFSYWRKILCLRDTHKVQIYKRVPQSHMSPRWN